MIEKVSVEEESKYFDAYMKKELQNLINTKGKQGISKLKYQSSLNSVANTNTKT
jgi:hypothetical protein